jgi:hypothetical protein
MIKRTMIPALLGLVLSSHTVLAQDMRSPAIPGPERTVLQPPSAEEMQADQKRASEYWNGLSPNYHDGNSPNYPFAP